MAKLYAESAEGRAEEAENKDNHPKFVKALVETLGVSDLVDMEDSDYDQVPSPPLSPRRSRFTRPQPTPLLPHTGRPAQQMRRQVRRLRGGRKRAGEPHRRGGRPEVRRRRS